MDMINDGYLSDVPTHRSASPSEVSQDLIASTKVLEQHFKEKYSVLRSAYEDRIKRMSDIINLTCKTLLSDEIIQEMKQDRASSVFVLSHANEVIDRHLESDREVYINELLEKISQQDLMLRKKSKEILMIRENAARKEKEQSEKSSSTSTTISQLQNQLRQKIEECEKLRVLSEQREHDINLLEHSFQQSAKELALIEGMDKKETIIRTEMKEQLRVVTRERQFLQDENYDFRMKLQAAVEEIERLQHDRTQRIKEEEINRQRVSQLMEQVEKTLEQEANESNVAISTVHDKMKTFRNRLVQELQKERKLNALLQEELHTIKTVKEDSIKDHRRLQDEDASLRAKLVQELEKSASLQQQCNSITQQITTYKLQISEWEGRCRQLEDRLNEQTRSFQQELKIREEAARMDAKKAAEQEQRLLEQKTVAFRLHYENEISKLSLTKQQELRTSQQLNGSDLGLALEDFHLNEVITRMRHDRDEMIDNHRRSMEEHRQTMETMRNELISRHQQEVATELRRQELAFKMKYEQKLADAQSLLVQAGQNIEKLKVMVKEGRSVITLQNQRIEHLKKEYDFMQSSILQSNVLSTPAKYRAPATHSSAASVASVQNRVAFGSTINHNNSNNNSRHNTPSRAAAALTAKENQSFQANASALDNSSMNTSSVMKKSSSYNNQSNIHYSGDSNNSSNVRTPQSTTVLASADTSLIAQTNTTAHTPQLASNNQPLLQQQQQQQQQQQHLQMLQNNIHMLQSQLDVERQRVETLDATIVHFRTEAEFYQEQAQQVQAQLQNLQQQMEQQQQQQQRSGSMRTPASSYDHHQHNTVSSMNDYTNHSSLVMDNSHVTQVSSIHGGITMVEDTNNNNNSNANNQAMVIIEEAQEEARMAKLRCLELESLVGELRMQLEKAEKASAYLNAQRNNSTSLTQQFGLLSPTAATTTKDQQQQVKTQEHETAAENSEGLSNPTSNKIIPDNNWTPNSRITDHQDHEDDDQFTIPSIGGLVQLQEKLEQSYAISKHWEERYEHQGELLTVAKQELQDERLKIQALRKREHELFTILTTIHTTYRKQIHVLRVDLDNIRSVASSFAPFAANEKLTSMNQIRYIFKAIFDTAVKKQEKDMKDLRIAMQSAHNTDISILEAKFIEQVNALNQRHTKELNKMHEELLARTERALNASMTASAGAGFMVTTGMSSTNDSVLSNMSILSSSQEITSMLHNTNGNGSSSNYNAVNKIGDLNAGVGPPAFESVLKGVLQGLRDQDAISADTVSKVTSLGAAHQEPSFAANAASRALIGDEIDRFVVSILQKKYMGSPSTASAAAKLGKELDAF